MKFFSSSIVQVCFIKLIKELDKKLKQIGAEVKDALKGLEAEPASHDNFDMSSFYNWSLKNERTSGP
ncbi:MAG: hypothetical protein V2I56_25770 [Desulfobacteraceae bacterium]|nr:hypothetical protein [Desulfobacteraceae bacterium]